MTDQSQHEVGSTIRVIELVDKLSRTETSILHALGIARGLDPDLAMTVAVDLSEAEMGKLLTTCDEIVDRVDQLRHMAEGLRPTAVEFRLRTLEVEAEAALSAGVADIERVELLARCLPVPAGFQALAAMLRCTDCHEVWNEATVGEVLSFFRGSETRIVREVTELARVSPELPWEHCDRDELGRLASVLERYAAALRK